MKGVASFYWSGYFDGGCSANKLLFGTCGQLSTTTYNIERRSRDVHIGNCNELRRLWGETECRIAILLKFPPAEPGPVIILTVIYKADCAEKKFSRPTPKQACHVNHCLLLLIYQSLRSILSTRSPSGPQKSLPLARLCSSMKRT